MCSSPVILDTLIHLRPGDATRAGAGAGSGDLRRSPKCSGTSWWRRGVLSGAHRDRARQGTERGAERQLDDAHGSPPKRGRSEVEAADGSRRDRPRSTTIAADVIGSQRDPDFRTITIDKGTSDGLEADLAVIAPAGVVGVVVPSPRGGGHRPFIQRRRRAPSSSDRARKPAAGGVKTSGNDRWSGGGGHRAGDPVMTYRASIGNLPEGDLAIGRVEKSRKTAGLQRIVVRLVVDFRALEEDRIAPTPMAGHEVGERAVNGARYVVAAITVVSALQTTLADRMRGVIVVDSILVVVVYVAPGPVRSLAAVGRGGWSGAGCAVERLHRDLRLVKTVVGSCRTIGSQIHRCVTLSRCPDACVFVAATIRTPPFPWAATCSWTCVSSVSLIAPAAGEALAQRGRGGWLFQVSELLPGAVERRRAQEAKIPR